MLLLHLFIPYFLRSTYGLDRPSRFKTHSLTSQYSTQASKLKFNKWVEKKRTASLFEALRLSRTDYHRHAELPLYKHPISAHMPLGRMTEMSHDLVQNGVQCFSVPCIPISLVRLSIHRLTLIPSITHIGPKSSFLSWATCTATSCAT